MALARRDVGPIEPSSEHTAVCQPNGSAALASYEDSAQENRISRRTAYRWAKDPKVKAAVNSHRRTAVDQSLAVMSEQVTWAAQAIGDLGKNAVSESVRLGALKAVFANLVAVSKFTGLEKRITELEEQFHARTRSTGCVA